MTTSKNKRSNRSVLEVTLNRDGRRYKSGERDNTAGRFYTYKLSKEERRMLAAAILINTKDHITLSQIADILYVSRATIINDLDEVKRMLESGKLKVISHSNKGLRLEGLEGDKRLFLLRVMSVGSNGIKENSTIRSFF